MTRVFVGMGSNIGDKSAHLNQAILGLIGPETQLVLQSDFLLNPAVTPTDQADYLNAVVAYDTTLSLLDFFHRTLCVEQDMGRLNKGDFKERVIDLDILMFGDETFVSESLQVPHPRFHTRDFVLIPFYQISKTTVHPVLHQSILALYHRCVWGVYDS